MRLVLIGIQGAGKSTQGNLLSRQLKIPYLSTGHILREMAKMKTPLGRYIKETINAGVLVPDAKMIPIVNEYLRRPEYKRGYILDGFPRTVQQAEQFVNNIDKAIYLQVPDKEALWRIAFRNGSDRADETLPAIKKRIDLFHKVTKLVLHYYETQNKLIEIDGTKTIDEVNDEILKNLGKQLIKNTIQEWKQKKRIVLCLVGMPGAGKTEAGEYLHKTKEIPLVNLGDIVNDYIDKHNLEHTEKNHQMIREDLRKKYGMHAFIIKNGEKIKKLLEKSMVVIVSGLRSWEERVELQKLLPKAMVVLVGITAHKHIRRNRLKQRKYRKGLGGENRDMHEVFNLNMGPTIALVDYVVENNTDKESFYARLDEVFRDIYFI